MFKKILNFFITLILIIGCLFCIIFICENIQAWCQYFFGYRIVTITITDYVK